MTTTSERAKYFSATMDASFAQIVRQVANSYTRRLLCVRRLDSAATGQIRQTAALYLAACLGIRGPLPREMDLLACFMERKASLANLTPNGVLMPKREHTLEFNLLHRAVALAMREALSADLVQTIQLQMWFRIAEGTPDPQRDRRPYATSKMHLDVWAGDTVDSVTVIIPVLGEPHNVTVEFYEMPRHLELDQMRPLQDYDQAGNIQPLLPYSDLELNVGSMVFFDSRLLHQTVRRGPGIRISLDFRFRRKHPADAPPWLVELLTKYPEPHPFVDYPTWTSVGTDVLQVVTESCAEARMRFQGGGAVSSGVATPRLIFLNRIGS